MDMFSIWTFLRPDDLKKNKHLEKLEIEISSCRRGMVLFYGIDLTTMRALETLLAMLWRLKNRGALKHENGGSQA